MNNIPLRKYFLFFDKKYKLKKNILSIIVLKNIFLKLLNFLKQN